MNMPFANRIKKEMTEGIVRALLEDAQYRVIDSGIEKVLRELSCLSSIEYRSLGYPDVMGCLPDFTVMNRDQNLRYLVEVKYRSEWNKSIFEEVREQVRLFGEIVLVSVNAKADDPKKYNLPSRFLRCCGLKYDGGIYKVQYNKRQADGSQAMVWEPVDQIEDNHRLWWCMLQLHEKFPQLVEAKNNQTLFEAVKALAGILDQ